MKVTYIHHSSFLLETKKEYLLFDYFQGKLPEMAADKPLYVFASHRHGDHFSNVIFELESYHAQIQYILSSDIKPGKVPEQLREKTVFIGKNACEVIGSLTVETFHSTDEGVAFLVTADGKTIYHAGDLNDWTWLGEEDSWNEKMRRIYRNIVDDLKERQIDAAFLPLDKRQESEFYQGLDYFMKTVKGVRTAFPMHFWGDYGIIERLKKMPQSEEYRSKIFDISCEGQEFWLD